MNTLKPTPFPSGPQNPFARDEVLERLEGATSTGRTQAGAPSPSELARRIVGPKGKPGEDLRAFAGWTRRAPVSPLQDRIAEVIGRLRSEPSQPLGLSEDSWALQAWARAVLLTETTPKEFGSLFATVIGQALAADRFDIAREMFQGLDQLRAGATLLSRRGDVHLSRRQAGNDQPLGNAMGLIEAARLGAVAGGASLLDTCVRLRAQITELSDGAATSQHPSAPWIRHKLGEVDKELARVVPLCLEKEQRVLEAASDGASAPPASLSDHLLACWRVLGRLDGEVSQVLDRARDVVANPVPPMLAPTSFEDLLARFDFQTARVRRAEDVAVSDQVLSAAGLELTDARGCTLRLRCEFPQQNPARPEIFASIDKDRFPLPEGSTATRLSELLQQVRLMGSRDDLEMRDCFRVFDAGLSALGRRAANAPNG